MNTIRNLGAFLLATTLATSALTGCFKHDYTVGTGGNTAHDPAYEKWHNHFFFGMIGEKNVNVREVCPSGNGTVKDEVSFLNGLVGAFVGIVYYPSTVEVYCADTGKSAEVTLSPAEMKAIASDPRSAEVIESIDPAKARELAAARAKSGQKF